MDELVAAREQAASSGVRLLGVHSLSFGVYGKYCSARTPGIANW